MNDVASIAQRRLEKIEELELTLVQIQEDHAKEKAGWINAANEQAVAAKSAALELIKLREIREEVEGYCDGAPDAGPLAKLANRIIQIIES